MAKYAVFIGERHDDRSPEEIELATQTALEEAKAHDGLVAEGGFETIPDYHQDVQGWEIGKAPELPLNPEALREAAERRLANLGMFGEDEEYRRNRMREKTSQLPDNTTVARKVARTVLLPETHKGTWRQMQDAA